MSEDYYETKQISFSNKSQVYGTYNFFTQIIDNSSNNWSNSSEWYPSNYVPFCLKIQTYYIHNVLVLKLILFYLIY
jgi:hypothetical protein